MSIQSKSQANHFNPAHIVMASAAAVAIAIAAFAPFVTNGGAPSETQPAGLPSFPGSVHLSAGQLHQSAMEQHEALTEAVFGKLEASWESLAAGAITEHSGYFPEPTMSRLGGAEIERALAEHWALIESYVS
jgi:hypothetical protein